MDYIYIRAWGRMLGSNSRYIEEQVAKARKANAPQNATYERHKLYGATGEWATVDGITRPDTRALLERIAGEIWERQQ